MKKNDTKRVLLYSEDRKQNEQVREAVLRSGYEGKLLFAENKVTALEQLRAVPGEFTGSDFVKATTGVDSVCERAAVLASGYGPLIQKKTAANGMTFALAQYEEAIRFE